MNSSNPITTYCNKCGNSLAVCQCKEPNIVCGTCDKSLELCKCETGYELKRCYYCLRFNVMFQHLSTGYWVCDECLRNKAIAFQLDKLGVQP